MSDRDSAEEGIKRRRVGPVGPYRTPRYGEDEKKGAVRLIVDGVKYQMKREGNETTSPEPKGPPNCADPDTTRHPSLDPSVR